MNQFTMCFRFSNLSLRKSFRILEWIFQKHFQTSIKWNLSLLFLSYTYGTLKKKFEFNNFGTKIQNLVLSIIKHVIRGFRVQRSSSYEIRCSNEDARGKSEDI